MGMDLAEVIGSLAFMEEEGAGVGGEVRNGGWSWRERFGRNRSRDNSHF